VLKENQRHESLSNTFNSHQKLSGSPRIIPAHSTEIEYQNVHAETLKKP